MELDYEKLKFKSGLEIHQQIDTEKLFCDCPSILRNDEPDLIVTRKLHAVAGEKGEVDVAVIQHTREGRSPYCLLYLLGSAGDDILKAEPFRWIFKRKENEDDLAVFDAEKMNAGKAFLVLADTFDIEFV